MKVSKETTAALLVLAADAAGPYNALAQAIGLNVATAAAKAGQASEAKKPVWGQFRDALRIAHDNGHTASQLRVGMETACIAANIPAGSFRSYVGTIANMHADVQSGELELTVALEMPIEKARERYPADPAKKARKDAEHALIAALKAYPINVVEDMTLEILARLESEKAAKDATREEGEAEARKAA